MQTIELVRLLRLTILPFQVQATEKGIEMKANDDLLTHLFIKADGPKLSQLLQTILSGILNNTSVQQLSLSTQQLLRTTGDVLLEFSILHNGKVKPHSKYSYLRSLVLSRQLVKELRGISEWDMHDGETTSHKFIIRCEVMEREVSTQNPCTSNIRNKKILLVEDNESNRQSILHFFEKEGVCYGYAADGKEAVERLENGETFDLILMDSQMPRMDGYQATQYVRKQLHLTTPILGMVAGEEEDFAYRCHEAGMNQFIRKPFSFELLIQQMCSFFPIAVRA